jgi:hypothetical protein
MCVRPVGHGPPGRSEWRRIAGWDPPLAGTCTLTRENGRPWLERPRRVAPPCLGSRRARAPRTAKATMPMLVGRTQLSAYRYLGSLAYAAVAVAVPVSLRGPGQHAVVLPDQFHRLKGRTPAQEQDKNPAWAGNDKRE